jgi:hypothetical protein
MTRDDQFPVFVAPHNKISNLLGQNGACQGFVVGIGSSVIGWNARKGLGKLGGFSAHQQKPERSSRMILKFRTGGEHIRPRRTRALFSPMTRWLKVKQANFKSK